MTMATKQERTALMLAMDLSDSETEETEFSVPGSNGTNGKNGAHTRPSFNTKPKAAPKPARASRFGKSFAAYFLAASMIVNLVLVIILFASGINHFSTAKCEPFPSETELANNSASFAHPPTLASVDINVKPPTPAPASAAENAPSSSLDLSPSHVTPNNVTACPTSSSVPTSQTTCGEGAANRVEARTDPNYVNVFRDLTSVEMYAIVQYLARTLGPFDNRQPSYNEIFNIELFVPTKETSLSYLDASDGSSTPPSREALVTMVMNRMNPPVVRQYVVGPLPNPSYHKVNPRQNKDVPASKLTIRLFAEAFRYVSNELNSNADVSSIIRESFGHAFTDRTCGTNNLQCIIILGQKVSFGLMDSPSFVFVLYYQAEFPTINTLPFQVIVSESTFMPGIFNVKNVVYAGSTFGSFAELVAQYKLGTVTKVKMQYPENAPGESSIPGSMNLRGDKFPATPHPPPRQYEPKGPRYSVVDQHVEYLQWSFNVRNSIESGPQAWDIRWAGERIVYELSLQEIVVLYAGANPSAMFAHLSDSAFGLGDNAKGMVPGVDCPDHATFLSTWVVKYSKNVEELKNTMCVFEHNSGVPLRRHRQGGYGALVDSYLVVRSIIVEFNYDYVLDLVFHNNGALEVRVYATGYIMAQWFHYGEDPFGFKVQEDIVGSVHHHLFHVKLDMDVGGLNNRYETLDFAVDERNWPWLSALKPSAFTSDSSSPRTFQQLSFKHHVRENESEAVYHYNFDTPKYHIFYTDDIKNQFGNVRAYRVAVKGFSKQMLPAAHPALRSRKWTDTCMAVTTRKEEEHKSSSIFSMYDADDPVVNFETFHKDNESIVDQDLVTWVTLGMHHIPHTEDIPNTPTVGTEASILLLPFNYFPEDPSMGSRDAVRGDLGNGGVENLQTYGTEREFSCVPRSYGWFHNQQSTSNMGHIMK